MEDDIEKSASQLNKEYFERIVDLLKECADLELLDFILQLICKCGERMLQC